MPLHVISILYSAILLLGGLIGLLIAGSIMSVVASALAASILLFCAVAQYKNCHYGNKIAKITTGILTVFFIYRFILTGNWMPAGSMVILSLLYLLALWLKPSFKTPQILIDPNKTKDSSKKVDIG